MEIDDKKFYAFVFQAVIGLMCSLALFFTKNVYQEIKAREERLNDVDRRLITIESSRCNSAMCSTIRSDLSALESQVDSLPTEVPPKWFLDKVNEIDAHCKAELSLLKERVSSVERREWQGRGWKYSDEVR